MILNMEPKQALTREFFPEYEAGIKFIWELLVELNVDIYIGGKILRFPFDLFPLGIENTFFSLMIVSFPIFTASQK